MPRHRLLIGTVLLSTSASLLALSAGASPLPPSYVPDLEPPNPVAGECYARVEIPARYEPTTQSVLTREGHKRLSVTQPRLESRTERIEVREPSVRYEVRQPTYATVTEQVMTRPAYEKLSVTEPTFRTVTETVQHGRPRLVWKRGNPAHLRAQGYIIHSTADAGVGGKGYSSTTQYGQTGGQRCLDDCVIWCLVEEPGESVTVTRQVLSRAGDVLRTPVPPLFETVHKQVVTDPGGVKKIPIPAEYRDIQVQTLAHPGGVSHVEVPPEYGQVQGRKLVSESRYEWRRVVCKPSVSHPAKVYNGTVYNSTAHRTAAPTVTTHSASHATSHGGPHAGTVYSPVRSSRTYQGRTYQSGTYQGTIVNHGSGALTYRPSGRLTGGAVVPSSGLVPDHAYSGPAYAVPPEGQSHPHAIHPGAARRNGTILRR
ncbi:MAG: hypothetical protein AAF311_07490 [Pseudomonadota bacterium]